MESEWIQVSSVLYRHRWKKQEWAVQLKDGYYFSFTTRSRKQAEAHAERLLADRRVNG